MGMAVSLWFSMNMVKVWDKVRSAQDESQEKDEGWGWWEQWAKWTYYILPLLLYRSLMSSQYSFQRGVSLAWAGGQWRWPPATGTTLPQKLNKFSPIDQIPPPHTASHCTDSSSLCPAASLVQSEPGLRYRPITGPDTVEHDFINSHCWGACRAQLSQVYKTNTARIQSPSPLRVIEWKLQKTKWILTWKLGEKCYLWQVKCIFLACCVCLCGVAVVVAVQIPTIMAVAEMEIGAQNTDLEWGLLIWFRDIFKEILPNRKLAMLRGDNKLFLENRILKKLNKFCRNRHLYGSSATFLPPIRTFQMAACSKPPARAQQSHQPSYWFSVLTVLD